MVMKAKTNSTVDGQVRGVHSEMQVFGRHLKESEYGALGMHIERPVSSNSSKLRNEDAQLAKEDRKAHSL